jgi:hypothetical protein
MNNAGAIYIETLDHALVAAALHDTFAQRGFQPTVLAPTAISGKIMLPEKRLRHFLIAAAQQGWVTVWEDPRYFADRELAKQLAQVLQTRVIWIEVSGNEVSWARGVYVGETILEEHYELTETTFYGEYGTIAFAFDPEQMPDEFMTRHTLPYPDLHYEAVAADPQQCAGGVIHRAFVRNA